MNHFARWMMTAAAAAIMTAPATDLAAQEISAGGTPQVTETHVVRSGDTLWDLCSKYLNSPWYWPKIWSYNPQLTNPHWIYPGNELRFYPSDENLPTEIAGAKSIEGGDESGSGELVRTVGNIQVGRVAPNSLWMSHVMYVTPKELERAGQIENSDEESFMLSDYDRVYLKLREPAKKGDQMAIYRVTRRIQHPITGEPFGYAVEIVGGLQVVDTAPTVATGRIAQSYRPVERGDYVGPWPENFAARIAPIPNQTEAKGYVIDTAGDVLALAGEHHIVYLDKGRNQGVQRGNRFDVLDRGDRLTREVEGLPNEPIGEAMVLDVQDNASTAIITYATREIAVGDKVEMRAN